MCNCGDNCNIPVGKIGPQGVKGDQGDQGATGAQGPAGQDAQDAPLIWLDIPLANSWVAGISAPQYRISGGYLYFRGVVKRTTATTSVFTNQDFGFTKTVETIVGDRGSLFGTTIAIDSLSFQAGTAGVFPLTNAVHTLLLDSIAPINIQ